MSTGFYRAFEDRHRGSRESIQERLRVYLPHVRQVAQLLPGADFVDVGCGRGEWIELLSGQGIPALGVDLDDGMLEACRSRGLKAERGDAVGFLRGLPDASQAAVSGFHIAEHLNFADLDALVREALRVLKPGGMLILETPNPENLFVATSSFYLDPTHQRPLPPMLLEFLAEHVGFGLVKVLRLQEPASIADGSKSIDLLDVLGGASPDYALVAFKQPEAHGEALEPLFRRAKGVSSAGLAQRFDHQVHEDRRTLAELRNFGHEYDRILLDLRRQFAEARRQSEQALRLSDQAHRLAEEARRQSQETRAYSERAAKYIEDSTATFMHMAHVADAAQHDLRTLYASRSWRLTAPVRAAGRVARKVKRGVGAAADAVGMGGFLRSVYRRLRGHPPPGAPAAAPATTAAGPAAGSMAALAAGLMPRGATDMTETEIALRERLAAYLPKDGI